MKSIVDLLTTLSYEDNLIFLSLSIATARTPGKLYKIRDEFCCKIFAAKLLDWKAEYLAVKESFDKSQWNCRASTIQIMWKYQRIFSSKQDANYNVCTKIGWQVISVKFMSFEIFCECSRDINFLIVLTAKPVKFLAIATGKIQTQDSYQTTCEFFLRNVDYSQISRQLNTSCRREEKRSWIY